MSMSYSIYVTATAYVFFPLYTLSSPFLYKNDSQVREKQ